MAELRERIVGRWPVAVLAAAVVVAVSLGDAFAGWNSFAERGYSAAGEYPIRIVLPVRAGNATATLPGDVGPAGEETSGEAGADVDEPEAAHDEVFPGDVELAEAAQPALRPGPSGLLPIEFDLAEPGAFGGDGGSAIEIRKAVRLNGADAGNARIRVSGSSTLSIAREELSRLLARSGQRELVDHLAAGEPFVSFDEMRRQGIEVRYDPLSDRILVST